MEKWNEHDIEKLKSYYTQYNKPSDQILKERNELENFTKWFNARIGLNNQFTPEELADQLLKLRKSGKLPRLRK